MFRSSVDRGIAFLVERLRALLHRPARVDQTSEHGTSARLGGRGGSDAWLACSALRVRRVPRRIGVEDGWRHRAHRRNRPPVHGDTEASSDATWRLAANAVSSGSIEPRCRVVWTGVALTGSPCERVILTAAVRHSTDAAAVVRTGYCASATTFVAARMARLARGRSHRAARPPLPRPTGTECV